MPTGGTGILISKERVRDGCALFLFDLRKILGIGQKFKTGGYMFQLRALDVTNWHGKAQSVVLGVNDEPARSEIKNEFSATFNPG